MKVPCQTATYAATAFHSPYRLSSSSSTPSSPQRFVRSSQSRHPTESGSAGAGYQTQSVAGCSAQQFLALLHRLRNDYKQQQSERCRQDILRFIRTFSLKQIPNVDARIVYQLLELLSRLQASSTDCQMIQDAANWLELYGSSQSTSPMVVTQCLRALLQLNGRELLLPVLLGLQGSISSLDSQRSSDSSVVLLAAMMHGFAFHDRKTTTSHQQLIPVMERLLVHVSTNSVANSGTTDLRLLVDAFGAVKTRAPDLLHSMAAEGKEGSLHPTRWLECLDLVCSVLAGERAEELSGSLTLLDALNLVCGCDQLLPLPSGDAQLRLVRRLAVRRSAELLEGYRGTEPTPSAVVILLQQVQLNAKASPSSEEEDIKLLEWGKRHLQHYFTEGERSANVAVDVLMLSATHSSSAAALEQELPTEPLSLLSPPPLPPPTGCEAVPSPSKHCDLTEAVSPAVLTCIQEALERAQRAPSSPTEPFPFSATSVTALLRLSEGMASEWRPLVIVLRAQYFQYLRHLFSTTPATITPSDFTPFFTAEACEEACYPEVVVMITTCMSKWPVSAVLQWLRLSSAVPCNASIRTMMRSGAQSLAPYMDRASSEQIVALLYYFGRAGVRNDDFCEAIAKRMGKLCEEAVVGRTPEEMRGSLLTVSGLAVILSGFAAVEFRATKPFLDAAPVILHRLQKDGPSTPFSVSPQAVVTLLAAYAKMLVWNFKVIWGMAEYLSQPPMILRMEKESAASPLRQLLVSQLALLRIDVHHERIGKEFRRQLHRWSLDAALVERTPHRDVVLLLSVWSRVVTPQHATSKSFAEIRGSILQSLSSTLPSLSSVEHAEVLLSLARLRKVEEGDEPEGAELFDKITGLIIAAVPTAPPLVLNHVVNAYALVGRTHPELFSLVSQRVIRMKNDIASTTIASILAAFAATDTEDAVLFMEMIPRVRFVAQYGTPRDLTNVVHAYTTVKVWHYKLFSRLADRAIQVRSEFSPVHLTVFIKAYAVVGMRYDALFTEMGLRIQAVAHLMLPKELATIAWSYAEVSVSSPPVFEACADHAASKASQFALEEAVELLEALEKMGYTHARVFEALQKQFPTEGFRERFPVTRGRLTPSQQD